MKFFGIPVVPWSRGFLSEIPHKRIIVHFEEDFVKVCTTTKISNTRRSDFFPMAIIHILKVAVVLLTTFAFNVDANSAGAGSCGEGNTSIQNTNPTNIHGFGTNGPLADAGVTFSVGGTVLTAGTAAAFPAGTDLAWSVDSPTTPFKGIFVRVAASGDFTHEGDPAFVDIALSCAGIPGVLGVDHFDSSGKSSVTGTSNFNDAGTATVDVVIVFSTAQWAYASYSLTLEQAVVPTETPVAAPVAAPTESPVVAPTETPVIAPIEAPVEVPVEAPVEVPVEAPVEVPVEVPVEAPVEAPVEVPVEAPVDAPVEVPVDVPTEAPTSPTTDEPVASPVITPTKLPVSKPPKAGKVMDMKMQGKNKEGMGAKVVGEKEGKKDKKGMKKRNLRY